MSNTMLSGRVGSPETPEVFAMWSSPRLWRTSPRYCDRRRKYRRSLPGLPPQSQLSLRIAQSRRRIRLPRRSSARRRIGRGPVARRRPLIGSRGVYGIALLQTEKASSRLNGRIQVCGGEGKAVRLSRAVAVRKTSRLNEFAVFAFCAEIARLPGHWADRLMPENATAQTMPSRSTMVAHI